VDSRAMRKPMGWDYLAKEAKTINANDEVFALAA